MRAFIFKMRKKVEEEERERGESRRPRSSSQQASASGAATFGSGFGNSPISPLLPSSLVASASSKQQAATATALESARKVACLPPPSQLFEIVLSAAHFL
jgi:hypothetical protein